MIAAFFLAASVASGTPNLELCNSSPRINCIVDGDTLWLNGKKLRPKGYDTPEPTTNVCGGKREKELASKATTRYIELLNANAWTIEYTGVLERNDRELVIIRIDGRDVGDILIEERLARSWPNGDEWWCP